MQSPVEFDKIPQKSRKSFAESHKEKDWAKIKDVLRENDCFLSHCPDCNINKVVHEWTNALFSFMKWEQWLNGGTWK